MTPTLPHLLARPLIDAWLTGSPHSWRRRVVATDSPLVHAAGTNADRVLLAGNAMATGRGVLTHDLGLPGHLARSLSTRTGRATDVDIVVTGDMTATTCLPALGKTDLSRFDVIVLTLGGNEALGLTGVDEWRTGLRLLLDDIERRASSATQVFLLAIPLFGGDPHFPSPLARVVDRHVHALNRVMQDLAATRPSTSVLSLTFDAPSAPEGLQIYHRWAEGIAALVDDALDPARSPGENKEQPDEPARQRALDDMATRPVEADPILDGLTESARGLFGVLIAAITIIDGDTQLMKAVRGMDPIPLSRDQSFCDITIRTASHHVIDDAAADPRYAHYSIVAHEPHIRFYAGYPIESPDGRRVGAFCVMDTVPCDFDDVDLELLRILAHRAQEQLWRPQPDDAR
jgi:GAF domain-containing protein